MYKGSKINPRDMAIKLILLVSIFISWSHFAVAETDCVKKLHRLADAQQRYIFCSTKNAVPVQLCTGCEEEYTNMNIFFDELKKNANCSKEYFDHDRLNIVQTTQNMLLDLWKKAYCDDCFSSNNSFVFGEKLLNLNTCLNLHKNNECEKCLDKYLDVNSFYTSLDQHNKGHVCYDMQDAMNQTRCHWSKELNCCKREFHMAYFLSTAALMCLLTIAFYGGAYFLTNRRERNHSVLNITENLDNVPPRTSSMPNVQQIPTTSSIIREVPTSTSMHPQNSNSIEHAATVHPPNNIKKYQNFDDTTDSDDDDGPLFTPKLNNLGRT